MNSRVGLLIIGTLLLRAEEPLFRQVSATPVAEALPGAFSIAASDVNLDGRIDLIVGGRDVIVVLLNDGDSRFAPGRRIAAPPRCGVANLKVADFDNDGAPDLAVYCFQTGLIASYRGDGAGGFDLAGSLTTKSTATEARGIVAVDLNQDGIIDLAVGEPGQLTILLGNGDATFSAGEILPIGGGSEPARPAAIVSADFNGDGVPDLAAVNLVYIDDMSVFLGAGGGAFQPEAKVRLGCRPYHLATVDFDGDGVTDLAVACDSGLLLLMGKGDGSFTRGPGLRSDALPLSVAAADLNGDGIPDFVLGNYYGGTISVVLGGEGGTLEPSDIVWSIGDVFSVFVADLNGDGVPDVAAASNSGSSALFAAGSGDGKFGAPTYFGTDPVGSFPLRVADFDGDGGIDLAVAAEGRKSILLRKKAGDAIESIRLGDYPVDTRVADFNGDGIPDLAMATVRRWTGRAEMEFGAAIKVLPGLPDGGFGPEIVTEIGQCATSIPTEPTGSSCVSFSSARNTLRLAVGEFTGDGIPDLVLFNAPLGKIQVYAGNGDGSFRLADSIESFPLTFTTGDFDGDGITDLAIAVADRTTLAVFAGTAGGHLTQTGRYEVCGAIGTDSVLPGDFNGDGKPDLAVYCGQEIDVLLNVGSGKFQPAVKTVAPAGPRPLPPPGPVAVVDFNGDGNDDLVTISGGVVLQMSNGDGTFGSPVIAAMDVSAVSLVVADFDADGEPDLAIVDARDGQLKIFASGLPDPAESRARPRGLRRHHAP